nr:50S ribosomal protein L31 [Thermus thalpophilus]
MRQGRVRPTLRSGFRTAKTVREEASVKEGIHPKLVPARIICGCGNVIHTYSTKPEIHVEVCSKCHPFYTGQQRFVDTEGRVERFQRRFGDSYRKGR